MREYQENSKKQQGEQEKLKKLQSELDALQAGTGKKDTKRLRFLKDEIIKTKNRIGNYDRMLKREETGWQLQNLIEREIQVVLDKEKLNARAEFSGADKAEIFVELEGEHPPAVTETGGSSRRDDPLWLPERDESTGPYYERIRNSDDVAKIAEASGMTIGEIEAIKKHVFFNTHIKYDGEIERFDASYNMAVAWKRLAHGNPEDRDVLLLRHELLEGQVEMLYNLNAAEAICPWDKKLFELLGEGGEEDGLL